MKQLLWVLTLALAACPMFADRGVVLTEGVNLEEPAQRAIVAHNGTFEMIILQTDLEADNPAKAIEFMPLPSKPEVSLAPESCFNNLQTLVDRYNLQYMIPTPRSGKGLQEDGAQRIKIVAEHELGPHHVTIIEIQDVEGFESWVTDYFKIKSLGEPILAQDLKLIVADYCERGFHFFAFDVITVPKGRKTVAPLSYLFKCEYVYYPLKVTNLYGGQGSIEVFYALNPWSDTHAERPQCAFYSRDQEESIVLDKEYSKWIFTQEIDISASDLVSLHPALGDLFRGGGSSLFGTKYEGDLEFQKDIWLDIGYLSPQ